MKVGRTHNWKLKSRTVGSPTGQPLSEGCSGGAQYVTLRTMMKRAYNQHNTNHSNFGKKPRRTMLFVKLLFDKIFKLFS